MYGFSDSMVILEMTTPGSRVTLIVSSPPSIEPNWRNAIHPNMEIAVSMDIETIRCAA